MTHERLSSGNTAIADDSNAAPPTLEQRALAAAHLFVRPRRQGSAVAPVDVPALTAPLPAGALRYWTEGVGQQVLLVHGREGAPTDLHAVAQALRERGKAIAWVELPAHGQSEIGWTSVPHAAEALSLLGEVLGPVQGIVAHSVGGALATLAMGHGLKARRIVLIGSPAEYRDYARGFASHFGLDSAGVTAMSAALREHYGIDVERVSTPGAARALSARALVIHSRDDPVVPFRDAEVIAAAWPGAVLKRVDGLGHWRILADPEVIGAAVAHVCD